MQIAMPIWRNPRPYPAPQVRQGRQGCQSFGGSLAVFGSTFAAAGGGGLLDMPIHAQGKEDLSAADKVGGRYTGWITGSVEQTHEPATKVFELALVRPGPTQYCVQRVGISGIALSAGTTGLLTAYEMGAVAGKVAIQSEWQGFGTDEMALRNR